MNKISKSDRSALIKLAHSLPKGDESRRAILAGLEKVQVKEGSGMTIEAVLNALKLLSHHNFRVNTLEENGVNQVSFRAPASMAAAYVENHLDEQFGRRADFDVESGQNEVYITWRD
jgi:hypothetical protein